MNEFLGLALLTGFYPLAQALSANQFTTLRPALIWTALAGLAWSVTALVPRSLLAPYVALCLSGCAGVAVLGARRPGVGPWNFVVAGLLAVLMLPVANGPGTPRLEPAHLIFLSATLAVIVLNYVPTRLGAAAALAGVAFAVEVARLAGALVPAPALTASRWLLALSPWVASLAKRRHLAAREVDRVWLGFRDRYGFLWAQRVREQFNRSAASARSTLRLGWSGIRPDTPDTREALLTLRSLLKRFSTTADAAPTVD
jgi:hypothetical protein